MAYALPHLDASHRQTYPMAIGLKPPEFLHRAKCGGIRLDSKGHAHTDGNLSDVGL